MWIVAEKILDRFEPVDPEWPINGTTGYDALNVLNRLFVSGRGVHTLRRFYQTLVDDRTPFREVAYRSKRLVMESTLRSGLTILAHALKRVADASWATRDISLNDLSTALVEFIASLPVYRTYLGNGIEREFDRMAVEHSFTRAVRHNPLMDSSALDFLKSLLLDSTADELSLQEAKRQVVKRLQQYTSSVHAKGVEDTAYYRDNTLIALNEVGGNPGGPSGSLGEFHQFNERRSRIWPDTLNTTSTHDTKLGEDTRIRIATLSVYTQQWISAVQSWRTVNAPHRRETDNRPSPSLNDEYRFYQILLGIWPSDDCLGSGPASPALVERVRAYMQKAVREAGVASSWVRPDEAYEAALDCFVRRLLEDEGAAEFRSALRDLVRLVLPLSVCHSISQLVLKCLMPGLPDIYQGGESWLLTVTDPDNRQPVDFAGRADALRRLLAKTLSTASGSISPDVAFSPDFKLEVTAKLLRFRRDHRSMMSRGDYGRLRTKGPRASSVVAFERTERQSHLVVAVPRLVERTAGKSGWPAGSAFWEDTAVRLPSSISNWTHILSGEMVTGYRAWAPLSESRKAGPGWCSTDANECSGLRVSGASPVVADEVGLSWGRRLPGDRDEEARANSNRRLNANGPADGFSALRGNSKPQTGSANPEISIAVRMGPHEPPKHCRQTLFRDPSTVIANHDTSEVLIGCSGSLDAHEALRLLGIAVFDRVRDQVHKNQLESRRVDDDYWQGLADVDLHFASVSHLAQLSRNFPRDGRDGDLLYVRRIRLTRLKARQCFQLLHLLHQSPNVTLHDAEKMFEPFGIAATDLDPDERQRVHQRSQRLSQLVADHAVEISAVRCDFRWSRCIWRRRCRQSFV